MVFYYIYCFGKEKYSQFIKKNQYLEKKYTVRLWYPSLIAIKTIGVTHPLKKVLTIIYVIFNNTSIFKRKMNYKIIVYTLKNHEGFLRTGLEKINKENVRVEDI